MTKTGRKKATLRAKKPAIEQPICDIRPKKTVSREEERSPATTEPPEPEKESQDHSNYGYGHPPIHPKAKDGLQTKSTKAEQRHRRHRVVHLRRNASGGDHLHPGVPGPGDWAVVAERVELRGHPLRGVLNRIEQNRSYVGRYPRVRYR